MTPKKWITVFLSLTALIYWEVGISQTEILRNEHLVMVGNDSDGVAKLWITSKLFASTITVPLDLNFSISSAYSEHSSKSRELTVESSYVSNTTSRHHIFIPLESAIFVATFTYNGSFRFTADPVQLHVFSISTLCRSMSRCASLGVYKIGATLYTVCASSSGVCMCELRTPDSDSDGQKLYTSAINCRLLQEPRSDIDVHKISNIVTYESHRSFGLLLFALNNYVYQTTPAYSSDSFIYIPSEIFDCLVITRLQIIASKLLIYCTNNSIVEYNMDNGDLDFLPQFNNHLYFPCSETTDFLVNLTNTEISYGMSNAPNRSSGLRIGRFKFGECIMDQNHHVFLYINTQSNSLHIVNSSTLTLHNLTKRTSLAMCMNSEYARPLIIGERYIIAYDLGCQITSVFDLQDVTSPIITQKNAPLLLASVISNLSVVINFEPTTASTDSIPPPEEFIIAPPIVLGVILFYSILNIIILVVILKRKSQSKNQQPVCEQGTSLHGSDSQVMPPSVLSLRNSSTQQLLDQSMSSRAPSGSSLPNSIPDSSIETGQQAGTNNFSTSHSPVTTEAFQESSPHECKSNDAVLVSNSTSV